MSKNTELNNGMTRRALLQSAVVAVPVALTGCATTGREEGVPLVRTEDPVARAVAYYSDTRDVEADNPLAANHNVSQRCANCVHNRGMDGPDGIMCGTFPGRRVSPDGWCSIWAKG